MRHKAIKIAGSLRCVIINTDKEQTCTRYSLSFTDGYEWETSVDGSSSSGQALIPSCKSSPISKQQTSCSSEQPIALKFMFKVQVYICVYVQVSFSGKVVERSYIHCIHENRIIRRSTLLVACSYGSMVLYTLSSFHYLFNGSHPSRIYYLC